MHYRKEIDGLRAIAVLPVILFHAGFWGFSGGYVGVDIFFVISGYLITSIIISEKSENKFSIINFYERRARRILPALSIVLLITTIAAYILMPAELLKSYSQSLFSVATFSSNIFFYSTSGYFSSISDEMPLLHTWSLAVEEQYYIFFPVMIVIFWPLGKKWLLSCILLIAVISLISSQLLSSNNFVDANFYLIFSRAWELFFGSAIAFVSLNKIKVARWEREAISCVGLIMIAYSILLFDRDTPFPSFYTLIPVLGTCFIIVFANHESFVGRILSNKILVFIGLLSYSLYLWHQPLFAFTRLKSVGEPSKYMFIAAVILTFFLAYLSWRYVEKPFRNKSIFSRYIIFRYSTLSITFFLLMGLAGHFYKGFEQRFDVQSYAGSIVYSPKRDDCHTVGSDYLRPRDACTYFGENITWASFGDSHTVEPAYALAKRLEVHNDGLIQLSFSGCPPSLLFEVKQPGCTQWVKESLLYLEENKNIENILIGFRYSAFLYGDQLNSYPNLPDVDPKYLFNSPSDDSSRNIYWNSLEEIISRLLKAGKKVHVLYPIPELPLDISKAAMPFSILGSSTMLNLSEATSSGYYFKRNKR